MERVVALDIVQSRQKEKLRRALGSVAIAALEDSDITEIILNPDGQLWVESRTRGMMQTGVIMSSAQAEALICSVASSVNTVANEKNAILECELPIDGSRFEGILPPLSHAPAFVIRKRAEIVYSLQSYVDNEIMEGWHYQAIKQAIRDKANIVVAGGTGTGKTTLVNALIAEMVEQGSVNERFVVLEDTYELRCSAKNALHLHSNAAYDLLTLTRATMRLRPDRIIVGEVRGKEAHALIKIWNTGHPGGVTTIHASSANQALTRLELLIQEAGVLPQPQVIADTVDFIISLERSERGRRVSEFVHVEGYDPVKREYLIGFLEQQQGVSLKIVNGSSRVASRNDAASYTL